MTSSTGNIFRVTGLLWGEFTGHWWPVDPPHKVQRPVTRGFDVFFDLCLNKRLSKQLRCRWFETPYVMAGQELAHHCACKCQSHCLLQIQAWSVRFFGYQSHFKMADEISWHPFQSLYSSPAEITFYYSWTHRSHDKMTVILQTTFPNSHFCERKLSYFDSNLTEICFQLSN